MIYRDVFSRGAAVTIAVGRRTRGGGALATADVGALAHEREGAVPAVRAAGAAIVTARPLSGALKALREHTLDDDIVPDETGDA